MSVGFIITVGLQLINQLGEFSKQRLLDAILTNYIILAIPNWYYQYIIYMGYDIAYIHGHSS